MKRDVSYPDTQEKTQIVSKKKIIPVVSDSSESSPSPEEPSTPLDSPQPSSISSRFRMSQRSVLGTQSEDSMMSLGQKLKNSYSNLIIFTLLLSSKNYLKVLETKQKRCITGEVPWSL